MTLDARYVASQPLKVSRSMRDVWEFDYAAALGVGESVASGAATLMRIDPFRGDPVSGFATLVTASTPDVLVTVTGAVLTVGEKYSLEVTATLNTAAVVPLILLMECDR